MHYGKLPEAIDKFDTINCDEMMFYQYLPISLPGSETFEMPEQLWRFNELVIAVIEDIGLQAFKENYIYITAKCLYTYPGYSGNRPGYHSDGFMTDDLNYIWSDRQPTCFNSTCFNVTPDDIISLKEFEEQADPQNEMYHYDKWLLKLNQYVIHKVGECTEPGLRTFVKISVSKDQYNVVGNSHNYLLNYKWDMFSRSDIRNPTTK